MKSRAFDFRFILLCLTALLGSSTTAPAATDLKLVQTGIGVYALQGTNFKGVAGTDVTIKYDKTLLANPRITWGNLATGSTAANTNQSGQIHIAAVDVAANAAAPGTGTFATITFDVIGKPGGNITATAKLIDMDGSPLATPVSTAPVIYSSGTATTSETDSGSASAAGSEQASATFSSTGSSGTTTAPRYGWGTISTDGNAPPESKKEAPSAPLPEAPQEMERPAATANDAAPQPVRDPAEPVKNPEIRVTGVLERFRQFQGEKSPKALLDLFKNREGIVQEPPVALSDGSTKVKVFLDCRSTGQQTPNFTLKGAKLVSLKTTENSAWVIELLPDKATYQATITISAGDLVRIIPLTVAPPLPAGCKIGAKGKLTESDFNLFLKKRGTGKAPGFDLNGDGKRDYMDDYIFTANFIVKKNRK